MSHLTQEHRDRVPMTREEVQLMIAIEPVLKRLGLSLYCQRCHGRGQKDGVQADNDPQGRELTVRCGCTVRIYRRTTAPDN